MISVSPFHHLKSVPEIVLFSILRVETEQDVLFELRVKEGVLPFSIKNSTSSEAHELTTAFTKNLGLSIFKSYHFL